MVRDAVVIIVIILRVNDAIIVRVIVSLNEVEVKTLSKRRSREVLYSPHHPADTTKAPVSRRNPNIITARLFILTI